MKKIIPELYCTDINATLDFYLQILGFSIRYQRVDEAFAYLTLDGVDMMFEEARGSASDPRRWINAPLERPFGRGINFSIDVDDIAKLYAHVLDESPASVYLPLEEKTYQCGDVLALNRQFIAQDPDGYLLRFVQSC